MSGKIKPGGVVSDSPSGTTFTKSTTHAPTLKGSSTSPKDKSRDFGIMSDEPNGTTFPKAGTPIKVPTSEARGASSSKVKKTGSGADFIPKGTGLKYGGQGSSDASVANPPVKKR
jgi:hypothetical protein